MGNQKKTILIVEDDEGLIELLSEILSDEGYDSISFQAGEDSIKWLTTGSPFLMILDYGLPDFNGKEFVLSLNERGVKIPPFIVSTGQGDERIAVEMMKLGALDYIVKDNNFLELIPIVIHKAENLIESERRLQKAKDDLLTNEEKQRSMIANIADVIAIVDANGFNQYKSPNIERLFGWRPDELIGQPTFNLVHPDDTGIAQKAFFDTLSTEGISVQIEFRYKCKDGSYRWVELTASNQINNPVINGILLNYHDINRRKEIENELISAKEKAEESDRLKTAFLQNMSHEIRTPMNAIMGFSSLMIEKFNNKQKIIEYSEIINQRCNDLLDIINDILDISKIESGQLKVNYNKCNLNDLFTELVNFFENHKRRIEKEDISFSINSAINASEAHIITDTVKLKQILINLINNAFKFTDQGSIQCGCKIENNELLFHVTDTGIGIPPDKFETVFERFTQLRPAKDRIVSGTGLGLSIVKGLVSILGGRIWLESQQYKGTSFYFTIPYKKIEEPELKKENPKETKVYKFPNKCVLIVEDDYFNAEYLKEILSNTGLKLFHTISGNEAVKIALNEPIDIILMDVRLPDINGYEATRIIKEQKPHLKIIAQTAYASIDEQQKAFNAGCTGYISKPTPQSALLALIEKQLLNKH